MSNVELTYMHDVLEPKVEPPKTLAEQQRDGLLQHAIRVLSSAPLKGLPLALEKDLQELSRAIAAIEAGKVPS